MCKKDTTLIAGSEKEGFHEPKNVGWPLKAKNNPR